MDEQKHCTNGGEQSKPLIGATEAEQLLSHLHPKGPQILSAVAPDGDNDITTRTFDDLASAVTFVADHNGTHNLYFAPNLTRKALRKKAAKTDIACVQYLSIDLDPRRDETPEAAKARYLKAIADLDFEPYALIDSGNGLNGVYRLEDPVLLGEPEWNEKKKEWFFSPEDQAKVDDVEARTKALTLKLGGTAGTQNIDRILHLPGTTNLPTKAKLANGRVPCRSKLVRLTNKTCRLQDLPLADENKPKASASSAKIDPSSVETIAPDDPRLSKLNVKWIRLGYDGEGLKSHPERSEQVLAFVCECIRAGVSDEAIASCLMHWKIGEHVRSQPDIGRALNRTIERAHLFVKDSKLFRMNERHCVLPIGGKTRVATWGDDPDFPGRTAIVRFAPIGDFRALHDKYRHTYQTQDEKGNPKTVTVGVGTWWIGQPGRRQYDGGMMFMPQRDEDVVGDTLNLWQGFGVAARKPDDKSGAKGCGLFLDHALKIICSGNEAHYDYLIKREAFIVQRRTQTEIAVGLKTVTEGTGKGTWSRALNHLYGIHAMEVHKADQVIGKHNKHLEVLLRLTADEALFAGDPRHRNVLYGLVTEPTVTIEPKFVDAYSAKNHLNIDILSNAEHFVQASSSARRLFIPTVSPDKAGDLKYFEAIDSQLRDGGYEALLYHLLHEVDIRDFNPRAVPKTAGLAEQVAYSRKGVDLLVEAACSEAIVPCRYLAGNFSDTGGYERREGLDYFIDHHTDRELSRSGPLAVKHRLRKEWDCITGGATRKQVGKYRTYGVIWPPLKELRAKFEEKYGPQQWLHPEAKNWEEPPE